MSSIAVGPPVTPSQAIDREALVRFGGGAGTAPPVVPFHAPPARVRTRRVDPWSRFRLAYVRSASGKRVSR